MPASTDISVVLSGGTANNNPATSLGGQPSATPLSTGLNNLFDDVDPDEALDGIEDYRCVYVFNDSDETLYQVKVYISDQVEDGSSIGVGIKAVNETQRIQVTGTPTAGSFVVTYEGVSVTSNYNSDLSTWASNFQTALRQVELEGIKVLKDVRVAAQQLDTIRLFDIVFEGRNGNRNEPSLLLLTNSLTPSSTIEISVLTEGSPVNTIAPTLDFDITPPGGVTFTETSADAPILIPQLRASEGFPIWVRRTVPPGAEAVSLDGGTLRITMNVLDVSDA
jgi:hypothetical protein